MICLIKKFPMIIFQFFKGGKTGEKTRGKLWKTALFACWQCISIMPKLLQLLLLLAFPSIHSSLCLSQSSALCSAQVEKIKVHSMTTTTTVTTGATCCGIFVHLLPVCIANVNRVLGPGWQAEHQGDRQVKYEYTHIFTFISLLQLQSAASTASCCGCANKEEEGEEVGTGNRIKSQQNY